MRPLLVFTLLSVFIGLAGHADPIEIRDSSSPDGSLFITITPSPEDEGVAAGLAEIRLRKSGKVVGEFEWSGFGVRADLDAFVVLWKPDNNAFTISYELTRGYMFYGVYVLHNKRWVEVKPPDYFKIIFKEGGFKSGYGKGYETPKVWLPNNLLKLDVGGRAYKIDNKDGQIIGEFESTVYLHLTDYDSGPILTLKGIKYLAVPEG